MSSTKSKLRLMSAFAALLALALAVACRGFFPSNTYTSLTIEPTTPNVPLNGNQSLQLWGTSTNSSGNTQITTGESWSIGTGTTGGATVTTAGLVTGTSVGAITVNAEFEGLTASASGVVYVANITSICVSTSNTSGTCSTTTEGITGSLNANLYAIAQYTDTSGQSQIIDITTSATWTVGGNDAADITCVTTSSPAVCSETTEVTAAGTADVVVSYPGTSITATNNFNVSP
jgi:hypothetical protein